MQDLQSIAQQSTEAEDHIEAVWNDVTALHRGRHNLSTTITSLKQLTMLGSEMCRVFFPHISVVDVYRLGA